ncbi:uncharacterized protein LOC144159237 [Haemaphysalis longicornis]
MLPIMSRDAHMSQEVLLSNGAIFAKLQSTRPVPVFLDTAKAVPEEVGTLIIIVHNRPSRNLPEPDGCWDEDAEDWESWRPPAKEPIFRPVPIGVRPADHCGYYALNAAQRPPRPFQVLQPSGASTGPQETSARSTLKAAAACPVELREYPRPRTTIHFLRAVQLPWPDSERDSKDEPEGLAIRLATLGRGRLPPPPSPMKASSLLMGLLFSFDNKELEKSFTLAPGLLFSYIAFQLC